MVPDQPRENAHKTETNWEIIVLVNWSKSSITHNVLNLFCLTQHEPSHPKYWCARRLELQTKQKTTTIEINYKTIVPRIHWYVCLPPEGQEWPIAIFNTVSNDLSSTWNMMLFHKATKILQQQKQKHLFTEGQKRLRLFKLKSVFSFSWKLYTAGVQRLPCGHLITLKTETINTNTHTDLHTHKLRISVLLTERRQTETFFWNFHNNIILSVNNMNRATAGPPVLSSLKPRMHVVVSSRCARYRLVQTSVKLCAAHVGNICKAHTETLLSC